MTDELDNDKHNTSSLNRSLQVSFGVPARKIIALALPLFILGAASWAQVPRVEHVFIVVEENQDFSCVIGNPVMKYLNELATTNGVAASDYANSHPSISNYFVLTTGQAIYKGMAGDLRMDPVAIDSGHQGGGRVPMVLVSSKVKPGYRSVALYHHENTLRLMLEALGLESTNWPGAAKDASSMAEFFTSSR